MNNKQIHITGSKLVYKAFKKEYNNARNKRLSEKRDTFVEQLRVKQSDISHRRKKLMRSRSVFFAILSWPIMIPPAKKMGFSVKIRSIPGSAITTHSAIIKKLHFSLFKKWHKMLSYMLSAGCPMVHRKEMYI